MFMGGIEGRPATKAGNNDDVRADMRAAEAYGRAKIAEVEGNMELLRNYAAETNVPDLSEWLAALEALKESGGDKDAHLKGMPHAAIATTLAQYIKQAQEWKEKQAPNAQ